MEWFFTIGVIGLMGGLLFITVDEEIGGGISLVSVMLLVIGFFMFMTKDPLYYQGYKDKATQEEVIILETLDKRKYNDCNVKGYEVRKAIYDRSVKKQEGSVSFSDIKSVVLFYDNSLQCTKKLTTIQELYKEVYGKDLFGAVEATKAAMDVKPTPVQVNTQVVDSTVTLKGEALLSPAKVKELRISAKECNRAKVKLLSLTEDHPYLTIDDYEGVTKLILDCENFQMQVELNK